MSSIKSKHNHPQWHLVVAIGISLTILLYVASLMCNPVISAAPNAGETTHLQGLESNQSTVTPHTILVGLTTAAAADIANATTYGSESAELSAFPPEVIRAEPLLSYGQMAVSSTTANQPARLGQVYKLQLEPGTDTAAAIRQLEANPAVLFAEPDYLAHLITAPNDPLYSQQWGLAKINAPAAWDVTTGSSNVVIAVIDSGLDTNHPDLTGQLWTNPGEIVGNGLDDDNNGYIDDIHGWNMIGNNTDLSDNTGHGTEVAGVIGAVANNAEGVAGVCWNCRLMVLKVTQSGGIANYSDIIEAIQYATLKGADVINLSLGGSSDSISLKLAVAEAAATAVVVGGAGNNDSETPFYPAAYESVLAVAGTDASDTKVGSSNYGSWIDVTAPGEMITTTFDGGSYGLTSGTSMAAPFASGLVGLLRSAHPEWSANTARAQIMQTARAVDGINPGYGGLLGSGRIDAAQALTTAAQPDLYYASHEVDSVVNGRPEPGSTVDLNVTLTNAWAMRAMSRPYSAAAIPTRRLWTTWPATMTSTHLATRPI
jgi:subtilisin family serine protease